MKNQAPTRLGGIFARIQAGAKKDAWKSRRYYLRTAQLSPEAAKGLAQLVAAISKCEPEPGISRVIELLTSYFDSATLRSFATLSEAEVERALQSVVKVVDYSARSQAATPLKTEAIA